MEFSNGIFEILLRNRFILLILFSAIVGSAESLSQCMKRKYFVNGYGQPLNATVNCTKEYVYQWMVNDQCCYDLYDRYENNPFCCPSETYSNTTNTMQIRRNQTTSQSLESKSDEDWKEIIRNMKKKIDRIDSNTQLTHSQGNLENHILQLQTKELFLENKCAKLEEELRQKNLLFMGVPDDRGETDEECLKKITNLIERKMNLSGITIDTAYRISSYSQDKTRPIKVQFVKQTDCNSVFKNANKLKYGNNEADKSIYVLKDLPSYIY